VPLYEYQCRMCAADFDVACPISAIDDPVVCPACAATNGKAQRQLTRTHFYGAKVEDASFSPALGKVVKSSKELREEAKRRGMIEVGNEKVETIHRHFERQREDTRQQRWDEAMREKVYGD